jgi:hypothetical protein
MVNSDFAVIVFNEHLGDKKGDIDTSFPFMGFMSSVKEFNIDGEPLNGYIIIHTSDMFWPVPRILINDRDLPGQDIRNTAADWRSKLSIDDIPTGFLKHGVNTIQIRSGPSTGSDNFLVHRLVVHWRERT